jgi:hypothetical protein
VRRVWKYVIAETDTFTVSMPDGARVVALQLQHGQPTFWAEVDDARPMVEVDFAVVGTGQPVPVGTAHVGTWQYGHLVWHLYITHRLPVVLDDARAEDGGAR